MRQRKPETIAWKCENVKFVMEEQKDSCVWKIISEKFREPEKAVWAKIVNE